MKIMHVNWSNESANEQKLYTSIKTSSRLAHKGGRKMIIFLIHMHVNQKPKKHFNRQSRDKPVRVTVPAAT